MTYYAVFQSVMAAWWLAAEVLLLGLLEWGARCARAGERCPLWESSTRPVAVAALFGAALVIAGLVLKTPGLLGSELEGGRVLARRSAWTALCTLWVGLEAGMLIQLLRIAACVRGEAKVLLRGAGPVATAGLMLLYLVVHVPLWSIASSLDIGRITLLHSAYVRLCGVFWFLLETACAIALWRLGKDVRRLLA